MTSVYVLQHVHSEDDDAEDVKLIGVYSSREKADEAVARLVSAGRESIVDATTRLVRDVT